MLRAVASHSAPDDGRPATTPKRKERSDVIAVLSRRLSSAHVVTVRNAEPRRR